MNIVIPAAGEGRRFREAGFQTPKMLIETGNRPMLYWALDSLQPLISTQRVIFICLAADMHAFPLERIIHEYCPHARIIALDKPTQGQAETVLAAHCFLAEDEPLLIYNCDTYMRMETGDLLRPHRGDGVIPVFASSDPCFSYVEADEHGRVLNVKEKEVISSYATTGLYHFAHTGLFVEAAAAAVAEKRQVNGEYYVAPLYNELIRKGYTFWIEPVENCYPIGTPGQWAEFRNTVDKWIEIG